MGLVLVVAAVALGVGLLLGGRLTGLSRFRMRQSWLVVLALVAQFAGALLLGGRWYGAALLASALLAGAFVVRNVRTPGLALIGAGLAANALVVLLNGAMPVSLRAARAAGLDAQSLDLAADPRHAPATAETRLSWLGDVVPVPSPVRPEVVSPGDLLVAAGVALLLLRGLLSARPSEPKRAAGRRRNSPAQAPEGASEAD